MNYPSLLVRRTPADLDTPVGVFLKTQCIHGARFLLESVEGGAARGRYSVIGLQPDQTLSADAHHATLTTIDGQTTRHEGTILNATRTFIEAAQFPLPEGVPPMSAGTFGYLGYDTIRHIEKIPTAKTDPLQLPEIILLRPSLIVIFDHVMEELLLCAPIYPASGGTQAKAEHALDVLEHALKQPVPHGNCSTAALQPNNITPHSNLLPSEYMDYVRQVKEYVAAGDIFQAVISQRFELPFEEHPFSFYRALRKTNPAPYLFYFDFDSFQIAGSSPEILVRLEVNHTTSRSDVHEQRPTINSFARSEGFIPPKITIRPIAGTRKRGATPQEDADLAADLLADPKERAEHLMLLDLGRNDVGKVSQLGTVKVTGQFFLEYYSHVMHIVSNVEGTLSAGFDALDALFSGFPAGTVSGAPKVRAMEIINELEPVKRGVYGGGVGYFSANGGMDTCIALRTAVIQSGKIYIQAGAGIVADSVPESEQAECENKARALVAATALAPMFGVGQINKGDE